MGGPHQPIRQGTSHVVPVVVSAGLAVGVFCGLLFGLGTGKSDVAGPSRATNGVNRTDDSQAPELPVSMGTKPPPPPSTGTGSSAGSAVAATGSGSSAGSAAGSGAGSAVPEAQPGKLTIEIKPDSAASVAKIFVDDQPLTTGTTAEIPFEPGLKEKKVKIVVQAPGYTEVKREDMVESGAATSLSIELAKTGRPTSGGGAALTTGSEAGASKATGGTGSGGASKATGGTGSGGASKATGGTGGSKSKGGKGGKGGKSGLIDI